jgi:hypothetical protein
VTGRAAAARACNFSRRSVARARSSPALNRGPRSGKFREGSNGFHLQASVGVRSTVGTKSGLDITRNCGNGMNTILGRNHGSQVHEGPRYFVEGYQRNPQT